MTIYTNTSLTNSSSDQEYFLKHLNEFGKIKEISCVFDVDNFIFFEDTETESRFTFIAKTYNGNKIFLKSVNCGYVGSGPNAFRIILEGLGVPKKLHTKYIPTVLLRYILIVMVNMKTISCRNIS